MGGNEDKQVKDQKKCHEDLDIRRIRYQERSEEFYLDEDVCLYLSIYPSCFFLCLISLILP